MEALKQKSHPKEESKEDVKTMPKDDIDMSTSPMEKLTVNNT